MSTLMDLCTLKFSLLFMLRTHLHSSSCTWLFQQGSKHCCFVAVGKLSGKKTRFFNMQYIVIYQILLYWSLKKLVN